MGLREWRGKEKGMRKMGGERWKKEKEEREGERVSFKNRGCAVRKKFSF